MKENATHIRLIRDKGGKPVEAEYHVTEPLRRYKDQIAFRNWAEANRIPVTGDWPEDKNVFAMDEVEPILQKRITEPTMSGMVEKWVNVISGVYPTDITRTAYRLKATLSKQERRLIESEPEIDMLLKKCEDLKQTIDDRQSEVTVKEGEQMQCCEKGRAGQVCDSCKSDMDTISSMYREEQTKQEAKTMESTLEKLQRRYANYQQRHPNPRLTFEEWRETVPEEEPQEAKTAEQILWDIEPHSLVSFDKCVQAMQVVKQQYQQEIIEKLTTRLNGLNWRDDGPDVRFHGLKLAINIIQSTK